MYYFKSNTVIERFDVSGVATLKDKDLRTIQGK